MLIPRIGHLLARTSWTVLDQAFFALANFSGNILIARWLVPKEYGGYTAATALFWLILNIYTGMISEPMMVFGSNRFRDRLHSYFAVLMVFHLCISVIISASLSVIGVALRLRGFAPPGASVLGYALAAPIILLLWLVRRAVYLQFNPRLAAAGGGVYMAGTLAILYLFYRSTALSPFTAPLANAAGAVLALLTIVAIGGFRLWRIAWPGDLMYRATIAHWRYGRWATVAGILSWAPAAMYYMVIMPVWAGLEGNAALNALWNLVMPVVQVGAALSLLLVPVFSRARQGGDAPSSMWKLLVVMMAGAASYALAIKLFGGPLIEVIYRGQYAQYSNFVWVVGLAALPNAAITVFESALRAHERPDAIVWAYVCSGVATSVFGIFAVATWGIIGGILGLLLRDVATALIELWWVLRIFASVRPEAVRKLLT
jgi:O-antigen/teichoic acid export membrane protein